MANWVLFDRFTVTEELEADEVFRYFRALDEGAGNRSIVLMQLREKWLGNQALLDELADHFEQLSNLRRPELVRVLSVARDSEHGIGIPLEPPGDHRLSQIDVQSVLDPLKLSEVVCEALHAAHNRGIFHGRLRPDDVWLTGNSLRVAGFGYLPVIQHGWRGDRVHVAPELVAGTRPDARVDVYSFARLLTELYPDRADAGPLLRALDREPAQRPPRMREFYAALEEVWSQPHTEPELESPRDEHSTQPPSKRRRGVVPVIDEPRQESELESPRDEHSTQPPSKSATESERGRTVLVTDKPQEKPSPESTSEEDSRGEKDVASKDGWGFSWQRWVIGAAVAVGVSVVAYFIWLLRPPEFVHIPLYPSEVVLRGEILAYQDTLPDRICTMVQEASIKGALNEAEHVRIIRQVMSEKGALEAKIAKYGSFPVKVTQTDALALITQCGKPRK
jgi:hypothetical protein